MRGAFVDGPRSGPGARIGATLHKREGPREWCAFLRNARRARIGDNIDFGERVTASVVDKARAGRRCFIFTGTSRSRYCSSAPGGCRCRPTSRPAAGRCRRRARITRRCSRVRKVRSRRRPPRCISRPSCSRRWTARGVTRETLTLHVGAGTFLPVKARRSPTHKMHAEWGRIDAATAERLNAARAAGGRLIAVGHDQFAPDRKCRRR